MQKNELRPLCHLNALSKRYLQAWQIVDTFRAKRAEFDKPWPGWCFVPMVGWYSIADYHKFELTDPDIELNTCRLAAIGTWRYTQGIYRFDQDLQKALIDTELTGDLPSEVLFRLPEWCIYIETPGLAFNRDQLHGAWVHLDWVDENDGAMILRLVMDTEKKLCPVSLFIGPWSLQEAITKVLDEIDQQDKQAGITPPMRNAIEEQILVKELQPLLSLILYICSEEPDMNSPQRTTPHRPEVKKTKKGLRLFAPDKPTIWRVGETIGRVLRQGKAEASSSGNSPRTHIRRAHWHGYWMGNKEQKRFKYNWLSPIVVRGREINEQE